MKLIRVKCKNAEAASAFAEGVGYVNDSALQVRRIRPDRDDPSAFVVVMTDQDERSDGPELPLVEFDLELAPPHAYEDQEFEEFDEPKT